MRIWSWTEKATDSIAELVGRIGWIVLLYIMAFGVINVFMRYVLNAASIWIGTTIQAAMVVLACLSGPYALKYDSFVKLDALYVSFSPRTKAILDVITAIITFLFLGVLIWKGTTAALLSIRLGEVTPTPIPIPIYPLKTLIPITAIVVLLVVIKEFVNNVRTAIGAGTRR